jgi:serralysin
MATPQTNSAHYSNVFLRALVGSTRWDGGDTVRYYLQTEDGQNWLSTGAKAALEGAMAAWSAVANIGFAATSTLGGADIVETLYRDPEDLRLGSHQYPASGRAEGRFNTGWDFFNVQGTEAGSISFWTFLHELGHALGLKHPFDGDAVFPGVTGGASAYGDYGFNDVPWTVMSYPDWATDGTTVDFFNGWPTTPMAFDIAAIQAIYGANMKTATGDDRYLLPGSGETAYKACIWDAGGVDTISGENAASGVHIDLRAATLKDAWGGGGYPSAQDGSIGSLTIAKGVVIENAIGSEYNDVLVGNAAANRITGGGGYDEMTGGAGKDVFVITGSGTSLTITDFQPGIDRIDVSALGASYYEIEQQYNRYFLTLHTDKKTATVVVNGQWTRDVLPGLEAKLNVTLSSRADVETGGRYADVIDGAGGNDVIHGGGGNDRLNGGSSSDTLYGGDGNDVLVSGNEAGGKDILYGEAGDDVLTGFFFRDELHGGAGNDVYGVTKGILIFEEKNEGRDLVQSDIDYILPENVEDMQMYDPTSSRHYYDFDQSGTGNGANNVIEGNNGRNEIQGLVGNDRLDGQENDDVLDGGRGADRMIGGKGDDVFIVDNAKDVVVENVSVKAEKEQYWLYEGSADEVRTSVSYAMPANVERLVLTGSANINGKGGASTDTIVGNAGRNSLTGAGGNDTLSGGEGADTLIGGAGKDRLTGDLGADRFVWADGDFGGRTTRDADRITDFAQSQGDRIDLSAFGLNFLGKGAFTGDAGELRYAIEGSTTYLFADVDGDGARDWMIAIDGRIKLTAADLII